MLHFFFAKDCLPQHTNVLLEFPVYLQFILLYNKDTFLLVVSGHSTAVGHQENCLSNCISPPPYFVFKNKNVKVKVKLKLCLASWFSGIPSSTLGYHFQHENEWNTLYGLLCQALKIWVNIR